MNQGSKQFMPFKFQMNPKGLGAVAKSISSASKKIIKGKSLPLAPNEIDFTRFPNVQNGTEQEAAADQMIESSHEKKYPDCYVDGKFNIGIYRRKYMPQGSTTSTRPKQDKVYTIPNQIISFGHLSVLDPSHKSNRKYSVQITYRDQKNEKSKKTVFFGKRDHTYYTEKGEITAADEQQRVREVNRTTADDNPLYQNFWVNNCLNRKGCSSPLEAYMHICNEYLH